MRRTLYFGYGSNLWRDQMIKRCPDSKFLGVARLKEYEWIISERGYANIIPCSSQSLTTATVNEVWGLVYALSSSDEDRLDVNEGVPTAYQKHELDCDFWSSSIDEEAEKKSLLVYVSRNHLTKSKPKQEYIYRMNMGIKDALEAGMPETYIKDVLRQYIPEQQDEQTRLLAEAQALLSFDGK